MQTIKLNMVLYYKIWKKLHQYKNHLILLVKHIIYILKKLKDNNNKKDRINNNHILFKI